MNTNGRQSARHAHLNIAGGIDATHGGVSLAFSRLATPSGMPTEMLAAMIVVARCHLQVSWLGPRHQHQSASFQVLPIAPRLYDITTKEINLFNQQMTESILRQNQPLVFNTATGM